MALNSYTYGTVAGVHRRVGWLTKGRAFFAGDTLPTLEEVEGALDNIAAEIHTYMATSSYPIETNATLTTTYPRVQAWLKMLNEDGAAAVLCMINPIAGNPDESQQSNPGTFWNKKYTKGLELIAKDGISKLGLDKSTTNASMLFSGSSEDSSGNTKKPIFTRAMSDYPASRDLTE